MVRLPSSALVLGLLLATALTGCTASGQPTSTPTAAPSGEAPSPTSTTSAGRLPACDAIAPVVAVLIENLMYDLAVSESQTAPEAYDQSVCVWVSGDGESQVSVSVAAIPFLDTELAAYGALPNAIADERLALHGAVLQTLQVDDPADGHLDGPLYLFDLEYSVTIQGTSSVGAVAEVLPQLTMASTVDAAFAVRELVR